MREDLSRVWASSWEAQQRAIVERSDNQQIRKGYSIMWSITVGLRDTKWGKILWILKHDQWPLDRDMFTSRMSWG